MADIVIGSIVSGLVSRALSPKPPKAPPPPPTMSREEAVERAQAILNPLYQEMLDETLRNLQTQQIARGFFGQLPGAALERSTAADIESRKAQQIAQLAEEMVGQEHARAMDIARMWLASEQARWAAQQQAFQNMMEGARFGANIAWNWLGGKDIFDSIRDLVGLGVRMPTDNTVQQSVAPLASSPQLTLSASWPALPSLRSLPSPQFTLQTPTWHTARWVQPFRL